MAELVGLNLKASAAAPMRSFLAVCEVLASSGCPLELLADLFPEFLNTKFAGAIPQIRLELIDLIFAEPVLLSAGGTIEIILHPSDRYLEFVAAVASCADVPCNSDLHGWPILSVAAGSVTVAEAGGASSPADGGPR